LLLFKVGLGLIFVEYLDFLALFSQLLKQLIDALLLDVSDYILLLSPCQLSILQADHGSGSIPVVLIEQLLQLFNFLLVLLEKGVFGVFVDAGLVLDRFGACGVAKGREGLFIVEVRGGDRCYHDCLGVASQGVLQETGQFRVSVRDVLGFTVYQGAYHVTKGLIRCYNEN
jgi:hypothetical protein